MAMFLRATRQAVRHSGARPALRGRGARLAVRPSAARKTASVRQRTGWKWPWQQQPEAPAPAVDPGMLLTILVSIFTIVGLQKVFIDDINTVLTLKLEGTTRDLTSKLDSIGKDVAALSADVRTQRDQAFLLQGKVEVLEKALPTIKK